MTTTTLLLLLACHSPTVGVPIPGETGEVVDTGAHDSAPPDTDTPTPEDTSTEDIPDA